MSDWLGCCGSRSIVVVSDDEQQQQRPIIMTKSAIIVPTTTTMNPAGVPAVTVTVDDSVATTNGAPIQPEETTIDDRSSTLEQQQQQQRDSTNVEVKDEEMQQNCSHPNLPKIPLPENPTTNEEEEEVSKTERSNTNVVLVAPGVVVSDETIIATTMTTTTTDDIIATTENHTVTIPSSAVDALELPSLPVPSSSATAVTIESPLLVVPPTESLMNMCVKSTTAKTTAESKLGHCINNDHENHSSLLLQQQQQEAAEKIDMVTSTTTISDTHMDHDDNHIDTNTMEMVIAVVDDDDDKLEKVTTSNTIPLQQETQHWPVTVIRSSSSMPLPLMVGEPTMDYCTTTRTNGIISSPTPNNEGIQPPLTNTDAQTTLDAVQVDDTIVIRNLESTSAAVELVIDATTGDPTDDDDENDVVTSVPSTTIEMENFIHNHDATESESVKIRGNKASNTLSAATSMDGAVLTEDDCNNRNFHMSTSTNNSDDDGGNGDSKQTGVVADEVDQPLMVANKNDRISAVAVTNQSLDEVMIQPTEPLLSPTIDSTVVTNSSVNRYEASPIVPTLTPNQTGMTSISTTREDQPHFNREVGTIAPHTDFITQQSAQIKLDKQRGREARQLLTSPAKPTTTTTPSKVVVHSSHIEAGTIAPYMDFVSQQSAQIKAGKQKEREALQALSSPTKESSSKGNHLSPVHDLPVAPYDTFVTQQSAMIKANKDKEREARISLHTAKVTMVSSPSSRDPDRLVDTEFFYGDAASRTAAQMRLLKEEQQLKKKEAEAHTSSFRQNDLLGDASSRTAALLQALKVEQAMKKKEAEMHTSSFRQNDLLGDASSRTATLQQSLKVEYAVKKKEAEDLFSSYRQIDSMNDAASRKASQLQSLKEESARKKKEAEEMARSFRSKGIETGSAQDFVAAELKRQQEHDKRQKKEAEENVSSYRQIGIVSDAASRTAAQLQSLKEETARKKNEAEEFTKSFRSRGIETGSAQDHVAAELKRQQEYDKRQKKEAQEMMYSYRSKIDRANYSDDRGQNVMEGGTSYPQVDSNNDGSEIVVSPRSLDDLKARTDEELNRMVEHRKKVPIYTDVDTTSKLDVIKSKAGEEIASLNLQGSLSVVTQELEDGSKSCKGDLLKAQVQSELVALNENRGDIGALTEDFNNAVKKNSAEKLKLQTEKELIALQATTSINSLREDFHRGIADKNETMKNPKRFEVDDDAQAVMSGITRTLANEFDGQEAVWNKSNNFVEIKSRTAADLASVQSNGNSLRQRAEDMVRKFGDNNAYDKIKAQTASEVSDLKGMVATRKINFSNDNVDEVKSRTSNELQQLKSTNSLKDRVKLFDQESSVNKLDDLKAISAGELAALRTGSLRDLATEFIHVAKRNSKLDLLKLQQAQELASVQDVRRSSIVNAVASEPNDTIVDAREVSFTEDEIVAFDEERKRREEELLDLKELTSRKKFDSIRSRSTRELQEIAEQRKQQHQNGTNMK